MLYPDASTSRPLREFNTCHNPPGAAGGRFCSSKAAAYDPLTQWDNVGGRWASKDRTKFDLMAIPYNGYRFLYHPKNKEMVLGQSDESGSAHAIELMLAQKAGKVQSGADDDYIKGWVYGRTASAPDGAVLVYTKWYPEPAKAYDAYADTLGAIVRHGGATKKTIVRGLNSALGAEYGYETPLGKAFPFLFPKSTRRKVREGWYPDSYFVEANDCHNPPGPGGGRFCSGVAKPEMTGASKVRVVNSSEPFTIKSVSHRRFLLDIRSKRLVLGSSGSNDSSHAYEFFVATGSDKGFDDQIRGWVDKGIIHFAPSVRATDGPAVHERYLKAVEYFINRGATAKTKVRGLKLTEDDPWEGPLGEVVPWLFTKKRAS